jgi:sugar lactone lactonase YvrE
LGDFSALYGLPDAIGSGIFRVGAGHRLTRVVSLPSGSFPNGIAFHDGRLYISDSALAAIWRVRLTDDVVGPVDNWLQNDLLAFSSGGVGLGANGIAFKGQTLFISVSDFGRVVRVPVKRDGSPGTPRVFCEQPELVTADGIAFDMLGRLWIVTNGSYSPPGGGLYRVAADGVVREIAKDQGWLDYPTMPVFGRTWSSSCTLYVLNGDFSSSASPDIVSLKVGVPGLPL